MNKEEVVITIFIVMTIAGILIGVYFFKGFRCDSKSVSFEGHRFSVMSGCMVKHKNRWLPLENIRGFD